MSGFTGFTGSAITGSVVAGDDAGQALLDFANAQVDGDVELVKVEDTGNFYEVTLSINGQESPLMVTKDGKYFLIEACDNYFRCELTREQFEKLIEEMKSLL